MNLWNRIALRFATKIEKLAYKIKHNLIKKTDKKIDKKYGINTIGPWSCDDKRYNRYEGTNVLAMQKLIELNAFSETDYFVDIGCGYGRLLLYLAEKGYQNLVGIEYDKQLYKYCIDTLSENKSIVNTSNIKVFNGRAEEITILPEWNVFYFFNPFRDKEVYVQLLNNIKKSVADKDRKITIIVLFPTEASTAAFCDDEWLVTRKKVYDERQPCYRCAYFYIFSNKK